MSLLTARSTCSPVVCMRCPCEHQLPCYLPHSAPSPFVSPPCRSLVMPNMSEQPLACLPAVLAPVSYDVPTHACGMMVVDLQRVLSCSPCGMAIDTSALALRIPAGRQGAPWAADQVACCAQVRVGGCRGCRLGSSAMRSCYTFLFCYERRTCLTLLAQGRREI